MLIKMKLDTSKIVDIELDGIDLHDWPDLCNAYISRAFIEIPKSQADVFNPPAPNGKYYRELTEKELEWLAENEKDWYWDYIYKNAIDKFY